MKLSYQLSKLAERDLENIWGYSLENWSIKQADRYINEIVGQIEKVCLNPEIGRTIFESKPDHRLSKINSHLIIYKVEDQILKVDIILHERMDIENQF